ncbi:MAG TPA: DNA primase [Clostridia bacterium]|nr:DNA primase [Clostridia bacterium]
MSYSIPENLIEEIRDASDIVDVISEFVSLRKRGKNYVGLCPFHSEKTPSFTVSSENQMFYCFGCGTGGNVYTFLMKYHGYGFVDAVKTLAERAGILLPAEKDISPADREKLNLRKRLFAVNDLACSYFGFSLKQPAGSEARKYLEHRGISMSSVDNFKLGWADSQKDSLCSFLQKRGFSKKEITLAGLGQTCQNGNLIDCFRSRLMFPISDYKGRVIGFGGRVLGQGEPKYLNTGETELFRKSNVLYGLHTAIPAIRSSGFAVIVEGYTDVISAHQSGVCSVIASLGTALTREQAKLLRRYTEKVIIAYDSDTAGAAATLRGMDILSQSRFEVRIALVPSGQDPDNFIKSKGGDAFLELVKGKSLSLVEYKLEQACKKFDLTSVSGRLSAVNEVIPTLVRLENEVERVEYIKMVSRRLSLSYDAVFEEVAKYARKLQKNGSKGDKIEKNRYTRGRVFSPAVPPFQGPEHTLVWAVVCNPGILIRIENEIGLDNFSEPYLRELLYIIKDRLEDEKDIEPISLIECVSLEDTKRFISHMSLKESILSGDSPGALEKNILSAKKRILERKINTKQEQLFQAQKSGDLGLQRKYLQDIDELCRLKDNIHNTGNKPFERGE